MTARVRGPQLLEQLRQSLSGERTALADFLVALAELDLGWSSAWDFCCRALGLSETATHYRLAAERQIQQQPELVEQIRSGRLCITTLAKLSKVLTTDNRAALVAEAAGKSTRQVEKCRRKQSFGESPVDQPSTKEAQDPTDV